MDVLLEILDWLSTGILPGVIVGIFMAKFNKRDKKRDDRENAEKKDRRKYEYLLLNITLAGAQLSYACAMAMKRGTPNGEVEVGVESYEKAMTAFRDYEREQIARKV